jgi:uncharacterized protein (TIGR02246 family)
MEPHAAGSAGDLAARQLEAYNRRDADAFAACYAEDVVVADLRTGKELMRGREELRARYAAMFAATPDLRAEVDRRIVMGQVAIDHERVTKQGALVEVVAIYEAKDGAIARVWFVR